MLSPNSFRGNDDTEMSSYEVLSPMSENISHIESVSQLLDLNVSLLKDGSMPVTEIKSFCSSTSNPEDLSNAKSHPIFKRGLWPIFQSMEIFAANSTIQKSKMKVALKFCLKKCGKINFNFGSSFTKLLVPTNRRFQILLTSLKGVMKSLANTMPSNVISQIHNCVINEIEGMRLQDYLHLFNFTFTLFNKRKLMKSSGNFDALPALLAQKGLGEATFVNPMKKPELKYLAGFQFAKPKFYECSYCDTRFYKIPIYIKHIRRHAGIIRCDMCWKAFSSVTNKRRHQLHCPRRRIV